MILSPEERAVGKLNFCAAIGSPLLRREFLMEGIVDDVAPGKGLGAMYFDYQASISEPVRVAVLGTGDEGSVLIGALNPEFIEVRAIADIRPYNVYRAFNGDYDSPSTLKARPGLMKIYGYKTEAEAREDIKVFDANNGGYEQLIKEAKELGIEGVIIALPLHLHAPAAIAAMNAGLHVITEKLMGHSVLECKQMAQTARETGMLLATGHQRHYSILYNNAVEVIKSGLLGDIHHIRAQWHRGNLPGNDSWQQPLPKQSKPDDAQADKLEQELKDYRNSLALASERAEELKGQEQNAREEYDRAEKAKDAGEMRRLHNARRELKTAESRSLSDVRTWRRRIEQKTAQIKDRDITAAAAKFGYKNRNITSGDMTYKRPPIEELIRWRLWDRTGGGLMAELGSHQLDAASIFVAAMHDGQMQHPLSVAVASSRVVFPAQGEPLDRDAEDHILCIFEFPAPGYFNEDGEVADKDAKIAVQYSSINGNGYGGYGETVLGTEGTLLLETEKDVLLFKGSDTKSKIKIAKDPVSGYPMMVADENGDPESAAIGQLALQPADRGYTGELEHWAWCIRNEMSEDDLRCGPKVALKDAVIALTTNLAAHKGGRIKFNEDWFDIDKPNATPERDILE
jgi:predicted dehydrogenase